jgi:hypothetical protein
MVSRRIGEGYGPIRSEPLRFRISMGVKRGFESRRSRSTIPLQGCRFAPFTRSTRERQTSKPRPNDQQSRFRFGGARALRELVRLDEDRTRDPRWRRRD